MRDPDFTLSAGPVTGDARACSPRSARRSSTTTTPRSSSASGRPSASSPQVFLTKNDVLLMQGEAVLGLEAAARGLVQPGTKVLNLVQGVFGKGMGYWLKDFGAELHELEVPYNDAVDPADVERYLDDHPGIELVTVVHSETPSGTRLRRLRDRPDRARARSADAGRLRLVARRDRASRPTSGSSTSASPVPRSASADRPECR